MAGCYRMTAVSSLLQVGLLLLLLGRNSSRPSEKCTSGTACQPTRPPVVLSKCFKLSRFCFTTSVTSQLYNFTSLDLDTFRGQQRKPLRSSSSFILHLLVLPWSLLFCPSLYQICSQGWIFQQPFVSPKKLVYTSDEFKLLPFVRVVVLWPDAQPEAESLVFIKTAFRKSFRIVSHLEKVLLATLANHWWSWIALKRGIKTVHR